MKLFPPPPLSPSMRCPRSSSSVIISFLVPLVAVVVAMATKALTDDMIITEADLQALMAIKQALEDPNQALRSWSSSSGACQGKWEGVKCAQGQVIGLQLAGKGLGGSLAEQVGELVALRKLNVHSNNIQGAIPSSIASLLNLRGLYLNRNRFSGPIPSSIAASSLLFQSLDLSHNLLSGPIPPLFVSSPKIFFLDLSSNNLSSFIPPDLALLPSLSILNLSHNQFNGSFPAQLANASSLATLDLSYNQLDGRLPSQIGRLRSLRVLDISNNHLFSVIPDSLGNLTGLVTLDLSENSFNGSLPSSFALLKNLTSFNCSFNRLTGAVPAFVYRFNSSSFEGNVGLCGYNASVACAFPSPPPSQISGVSAGNVLPAGRKHRFSTATFLIIVIGSAVAGVLLLCLVLALCCVCCRKTPAAGKTTSSVEKSSSQSSGGREATEVGGGKLVHFDGAFTFTADDLLCATAEVLGKSTYGTVYKATFEDGNRVAVKRLREGIVKSQRDFETEVNTLGRTRHPNLLALRGYYWGPKDEKLLIYDFMSGGSLAAFLHARGPETPLNWNSRLNIAAGAARGLAHLHENERIIHGNLTSSNILLDSRMNAKLSDFALSRLMTTVANSNVIATASALGYRAPELTKLRKATTKSDVYSFGIVLLELLTGKAPGDTVAAETGMDLPEWVASIVKEEWTNEIFDLELMKGVAPSEDELINTLQLAMNCVTPAAGSRPPMGEVAHQLEETLIKPEGRQTPSSESSAV